MARTRTFKTSFTGGEITPELFGRPDLDRQQNGLALCENFVVLPHGPVQNRAGLRFCNAAKGGDSPTRVLPFSFSNSQTFAIELGAGYFRFFSLGEFVTAPGADIVTNGSFAAGSTTGWTDASDSGSNVLGVSPGGGLMLNPSGGSGATPPTARAEQSLTTVAGQPYTVTATVPTSINGIVPNPFQPVQLLIGSTAGAADLLSQTLTPASTSYTFAFTPTGTTTYLTLACAAYTLAPGFYEASTGFINYVAVNETSTGAPYELANSYAAADLMDIHYVQSGDVVTLVHPGYPPMELRRYGNQDWTFTQIEFGTQLTAPSGVTATASYSAPPGDFPSGYTDATVYTYGYVVTAVSSDGTDESLQSNTATCNNNLAVPGAHDMVRWTAPTPVPAYYNVYKSINGGGFGFIAQVPGSATSFDDGNVTPDTTQSPPLQDSILNSANNYPAAVGYYEQRRVFGGTNNNPETFYATQPGTQSNMNYSLPSQASDRLSVTIAAQRANYIEHIVALLDMILLTKSTEWRVFTASGDALTPSTVTVKAQWQCGANNVQPQVVNNACLYAASQGGHVRALSYDWTLSGYKSEDLCLLAKHLFHFEIVDMAFVRSPYPILWAVTSAGLLLGLTWLPDQQVQAWHRQVTAGAFESVCAVTEGNVDVLYAVVRRQIDGVWSRYIERMDSRSYLGEIADAFFVDCGATYTAPAGSFTYDLVNGRYDCAVTGHGLTTGQSIGLLFSAVAFAGAFAVIFEGNQAAVSCYIPAHGLTAGQMLDLSFTDPVYDGRYPVTVDDANHFHVTIAAAQASTNLSGTVNYTLADANSGTHTVTVTDANHFYIAVSSGRATGSVQLQVTHVSGLSWLAGATVAVLADGVVQPQQAVTSGGAITLATPAAVVQVGLPYASTLETPPVAIAGDPSMGQGRIKAVNVAWARCVDFTGCVAGSGDSQRRVPVPALAADDNGNPALANGEFRIKPFGNFNTDAGIVITQVNPLPLTVCDITLEVDVEG